MWQVLYLFKTDVLDRQKFRRDSELQNSIRWLTQDKSGAAYKAMRAIGVTFHMLGPDSELDGEATHGDVGFRNHPAGCFSIR